MTKRRLFDEVRERLEAIRDDRAMPQHEIPPPDVKAVRKALGISQARLAVCLGVSARTLRSWEQGRGAPEGATLTLLRIMEKEPNVVMSTLHPIFRLVGAGRGDGRPPGARDKHAILDK